MKRILYKVKGYGVNRRYLVKIQDGIITINDGKQINFLGETFLRTIYEELSRKSSKRDKRITIEVNN